MNKKCITFDNRMSKTTPWKDDVEEETVTQSPWKEMHPGRRTLHKKVTENLEDKASKQPGKGCGGQEET